MPKKRRCATNKEIARVLEEIGLILGYEDIAFKPAAYEAAADTVHHLDRELAELYGECGTSCIDDLPGIGESIAGKIAEMLETGSLGYYDKLKKKYPVDVLGISEIPDVGPKTAIRLYKELGIRNIDDLEEAAAFGKVASLKGFSKKTEQKILDGIKLLRKQRGRMPLDEAKRLAKDVLSRLRRSPAISRVEAAGSLRREKETVGDLDLVAASTDPKGAMRAFARLPNVTEMLEQGETRATARLKNGTTCDLLIVPPVEFGAALLHFTGSREHNIHLREIAIRKGWKLNEHGLFDGEKRLASRTEASVYRKLGLKPMPPRLRLDTGEIEAAMKK